MNDTTNNNSPPLISKSRSASVTNNLTPFERGRAESPLTSNLISQDNYLLPPQNEVRRKRSLSDGASSSCSCGSPSSSEAEGCARRKVRVFRPSDLLVEEKLGEGFFGVAWKVRHKTTGEVMVMKEMRRVDQQVRMFDAECRRNFSTEMAMLRSLSHPNILRLLGVILKNSCLLLLTEYLSGGSLETLLHNRTDLELSWSQRTAFARDISSGMEYLHSCSLIHRDLCSPNCLVRKDMTIVVADFGLASFDYNKGKLFNPNERYHDQHHPRYKNSATRRMRIVGRPYWMAPEMLVEKPYDHKVDLFSFGIILCEVISRQPADPDLLRRHDDYGLDVSKFVSNFVMNTDCPRAFLSVAVHCCQMSPQLRPSFETVHRWLNRLMLHLEMGTTPPISFLAAETCHENAISKEVRLDRSSSQPNLFFSECL